MNGNQFRSLWLAKVLTVSKNLWHCYKNHWKLNEKLWKCLPASFSISDSCSADFITRNFCGIRLQTLSRESENPTAIREESSHISTQVTLEKSKKMVAWLRTEFDLLNWLFWLNKIMKQIQDKYKYI